MTFFNENSCSNVKYLVSNNIKLINNNKKNYKTTKNNSCRLPKPNITATV